MTIEFPPERRYRVVMLDDTNSVCVQHDFVGTVSVVLDKDPQYVHHVRIAGDGWIHLNKESVTEKEVNHHG